VEELLTALESHFPGFLARLTDENGKLRRFLNVYVNRRGNIRLFLRSPGTALSDG